MRHQVFGRKLSRDTNARKALLGNLTSSVLKTGQLETTLAKAKFARPYVEKLITYAKRKNDLRTDRYLASLVSKEAFSKLRLSIGPGFKSRTGGYTRIIKLVPRKGDAAPMARLELLKLDKLATTENTENKQKDTKVKPTKSVHKSTKSVAAK